MWLVTFKTSVYRKSLSNQTWVMFSGDLTVECLTKVEPIKGKCNSDQKHAISGFHFYPFLFTVFLETFEQLFL